MAYFDVAVGLTVGEINNLLTQFFTTVSPVTSPFKGSETKTIDILGTKTEVTLNWNITETPVVTLGPPDEEVWETALGPDGKTNKDAGRPLPTGDMVQLAIPVLEASAAIGKAPPVGGSAKDTVVYATVAAKDDDILVTLAAVTIDESGFSLWDKAIFNDLLLPRIFKTAQAAVGVIHIPKLTWHGVTLETPSFVLTDTQLVSGAVLKGSSTSVDLSGVTWPTEDLFVLASEDMMNAALAAGLSELVSDANANKTSYGLKGSDEFKKLADYSWDSTLESATATVSTISPLEIDASVTLGSVELKADLTALGWGLAAVGCALGGALAMAA